MIVSRPTSSWVSCLIAGINVGSGMVGVVGVASALGIRITGFDYIFLWEVLEASSCTRGFLKWASFGTVVAICAIVFVGITLGCVDSSS